MQGKEQLTLAKQIDETVFALGSVIREGVVEKDFYVTKIIHAISDLNHDYYNLVFQGGTCLAKAYKVIPRMSEDCDFRIEIKTSVTTLSKTKARNKLKEFRDEIIKLLEASGFVISKDNILVRDEGRFMSMKLQYDTLYSQQSALKPFLALDFFLAEVKTPTVKLPVTTLIRETIGNAVNHLEKTICCISIVETAAEKMVGLTRRIMTIGHRQYYEDSALVRHIYDLYKINQANKLGDDFTQLVIEILKTEIEKFKSHNVDYFADPRKESKRALQVLKSPVWEKHWEEFVDAMVFEQKPPTYKKALQNLNELAELCFSKKAKES